MQIVFECSTVHLEKEDRMYGKANRTIEDTRPTLIYCRESRDENFADYERIETQRDILVDFCRKKGLVNVVDIVMDDDTSGTSFKRFQPIIERIKRKEIQVIVFKDSSRLGRNLRESLNFVDLLENFGAEIIFESEEYDEDFFPLKAWFNEQRAKEDSKKIRRVLMHKMETGTLLVKPKYGYQRNPENECEMIPREDTAEIVRWLFQEVRKGRGLYELASELNRRGIPTPSQAAGLSNSMSCWVAQHVRRIVTDPVYTGVMIHNQKVKKSFKNKKIITRPKEEWIVLEGHHEPLITQQEFDEAQEMRRKIKYTRPTTKNRPFSGLLKCGRCGHNLVLRFRKGRPDAYICGKNHKEGTIKDEIREDYGCSAHLIREDFLYAVVIKYVHQMLQVADVDLQDIVRQSPRTATIEHREEELQAKLQQVRKTIGRIYDDRLADRISEGLFTSKYAEYTEMEKALTQQIQDLPRTSKTTRKLTNLQLEDIVDALNDQTITKEQLHLIFSSIIVYAPGDISEETKEDLGLTRENYEQIKEKGGVLFLENATPSIGIMVP